MKEYSQEPLPALHFPQKRFGESGKPAAADGKLPTRCPLAFSRFKRILSPMEFVKRFLRTVWQPSQENYMPGEPMDAEARRHALLIVGFCTVGGVFSIGFAGYYLIIGHHAGVQAILANSLIFSTLPLLFLKKGKADAAAMIFVLSLIFMFSWLSVIEGGVKGHAVAWLVIMPFCSQLLILKRAPMIAVNVLMLILIALFSGMEVWGFRFPILYGMHHHGWVTLVGYTGLGVFMFALGFLVEHYRRIVVRERDRAEAELQEAVDELTQLNLEKNEFLGIAAHDLNNPLSVVGGYAELLKEFDSLSPEDVTSYATEIMQSTRRMQKIIQDVLDVNTIESGTYPLHMEEVEMRPAFEACLNTYREAAEKKHLTLETELEECCMETDRGALEQVLDNLVSNAVKYARPEGRIRVALARREDGIQFEVFNEGRGFTEEDKTRLFSRFAKLSTRPTAGEGSVGLGLSITHKIINAMGGQIECESELNEGALFRVRLPESTSD